MYYILMNNLHSDPILSNESKGVLLGIILYISKHLTKLSGLTIQINLSRYIKPLSKLFTKIRSSSYTISSEF